MTSAETVRPFNPAVSLRRVKGVRVKEMILTKILSRGVRRKRCSNPKLKERDLIN